MTSSEPAEHEPTLVDRGSVPTHFPAAPDDDLEHQRILAAAGAALFGLPALRIGRYRILRQLGSGAMGEVFLAHDETLDRRVALKLLRRELTRTAPSDLLQREARALARLSHPNVVQVHEFGLHDERAYLVMEYVEGRTLTSWLVHAAPSRQAILAVVGEAGTGLAAAHALGLTHRDFKPDNILVGVDRRTRVADFGLAHFDAESLAGSRAGTPRYMAPEQLAGGRVDARSDQFGFCVVLAEALWGEPLRDPTRKPPTSTVPGWLWRVIRRGLSPEPEQRWPDMPSLLRALDPRPRRRRRVAAALGFGVMAAAMIWPSAPTLDGCLRVERELDASWGAARAEQLRSRGASLDPSEQVAVEPLITALDEWAEVWRAVRLRTCRSSESEVLLAQRELCLGHQRRRVMVFVDQALARPEQLSVYARELAHALPSPAICEHDEALSSGIAAPSLAIAGEVDALRERVDQAAAARLLGDAETSLPGLAEAVAKAEQLGYRPVLAELQAELGSAELLAGSREHGIAWIERAGRNAYLAHDDRLAASLWLELSWQAVEQGEVERGRHWFERGSDAWTRLGVDAAAEARLDYGTGMLALADDRLDDAERSLNAALAGPEPGLQPFVLERLAELAERRGASERALALREQARDAAADYFGPEHPRTAQQRYGLGLALRDAGRTDEAKLEFERAVASWQRAHHRAHENLADAHTLLAVLALDAGQLDVALVHAERVLVILAELVPADDEAFGDAWTVLGILHHARGEFEPAIEAFSRARAVFDAALGPASATSLRAAGNVGVGLLALGRLDEARAMFEHVLLDPVIDEEREPDRRVAQLGLAEIELRSGRPEAAKQRLAAMTSAMPSFDAIERLEHALLLGLADLRVGIEPDPQGLARARVDAGEQGIEIVDRHVANLAIDTAESRRLGLR